MLDLYMGGCQAALGEPPAIFLSAFNDEILTELKKEWPFNILRQSEYIRVFLKST